MKPSTVVIHVLSCLAAFFGGCLSASARTEIPHASQPQLAVSADGSVWVAYGRASAAPNGGGAHAHGAPRPDGDVLIARSDDGGATFQPEVKIATVPNLMLGMRRGPRIAVRGDRVTVTVIGHALVAFHSSDRGVTWSGPVTINDVESSAREGLHDLALAPDGRLFVTWLDLRHDKMELWGASSRDGGRSWSANERVYRSPDISICECCHPSALYDAEGNLAVMWRNSIEGSRDLWIATRPAGARGFTPARKLGEGTWKLNACPMDGGRLLALGEGKFGAVWQRAGEIFFSRDGAAEISLGQGTQPVAITQDDYALVCWQQGTDLVLAQGFDEVRPRTHAAGGRFAALAALPRGEGAVLAYEQGGSHGASIVVERLE